MSSLSDVDPDPGRTAVYTGTSGQAGVMAYSGACFDPSLGSQGSLLIHGGGDADYWGNEVYRWDKATATFTRLNNPSTGLTGVPSTDPGYDQTHCEYTDGTPGASHTYNHLHAISGIMYMTDGLDAYGAHNTSWSHAFNTGSNTWSRFSTNAFTTSEYQGTSIYRPSDGRIYWTRAGGFHTTMAYMPISTGTWVNAGTPSINVGHDPCSYYDASRDYWILVNTYANVFRVLCMDMANQAAGFKLMTLSGTAIPNTSTDFYGPGVDYYAGDGYVYRGQNTAGENTTVWKLTPTSATACTVTKITLGSALPTENVSGVFSKWRYIGGGQFGLISTRTAAVTVWTVPTNFFGRPYYDLAGQSCNV